MRSTFLISEGLYVPLWSKVIKNTDMRTANNNRADILKTLCAELKLF